MEVNTGYPLIVLQGIQGQVLSKLFFHDSCIREQSFFFWRSLLGARDILYVGSFWWVGDGKQLGFLLINGTHIPQCLWMKTPRNCEFVISLMKTQANEIRGNSRPSMHIELDKKFWIFHSPTCTQRTRWSGRKTETINSWGRQPTKLHCGWTIQLR